ncbi:MAG: hypothetical protein IPI49_04390 [Myxococcales bacterium]|nr:hypothetical protein [Myxococcales bacterium]
MQAHVHELGARIWVRRVLAKPADLLARVGSVRDVAKREREPRAPHLEARLAHAHRRGGGFLGARVVLEADAGKRQRHLAVGLAARPKRLVQLDVQVVDRGRGVHVALHPGERHAEQRQRMILADLVDRLVLGERVIEPAVVGGQIGQVDLGHHQAAIAVGGLLERGQRVLALARQELRATLEPARPAIVLLGGQVPVEEAHRLVEGGGHRGRVGHLRQLDRGLADQQLAVARLGGLLDVRSGALERPIGGRHIGAVEQRLQAGGLADVRHGQRVVAVLGERRRQRGQRPLQAIVAAVRDLLLGVTLQAGHRGGLLLLGPEVPGAAAAEPHEQQQEQQHEQATRRAPPPAVWPEVVLHVREAHAGHVQEAAGEQLVEVVLAHRGRLAQRGGGGVLGLLADDPWAHAVDGRHRHGRRRGLLHARRRRRHRRWLRLLICLHHAGGRGGLHHRHVARQHRHGQRRGRIQRLAGARALEQREQERAGRIQVLGVLQHRHRALGVAAAQEDLTQQGKAQPVGAVHLHHPQEFALRFFPLMQRVVRACQQHAALDVVRRAAEPHVAHFDDVFGSTEREVRLAELKEGGGRVTAHRIDQLFHLLRGRSAI